MRNINVGDGFPVPPHTVVDKTGRETRPLQYFAVTPQIIYLLKYRALCIKLCGFFFWIYRGSVLVVIIKMQTADIFCAVELLFLIAALAALFSTACRR